VNEHLKMHRKLLRSDADHRGAGTNADHTVTTWGACPAYFGDLIMTVKPRLAESGRDGLQIASRRNKRKGYRGRKTSTVGTQGPEVNVAWRGGSDCII